MYNRNFSDIQEDLIALTVSAAQGQTLHDRLYQAMLAIVHAFDTSPLYRNAYADNPVISADTDKERKSWGQVLSEICHAVGLENPVPMVVLEYYFGVLEILHRSKEKFGSAEKANEVMDAMETMLHHIAEHHSSWYTAVIGKGERHVSSDDTKVVTV